MNVISRELKINYGLTGGGIVITGSTFEGDPYEVEIYTDDPDNIERDTVKVELDSLSEITDCITHFVAEFSRLFKPKEADGI